MTTTSPPQAAATHRTTRGELEEMVERWLAANRRAEETGDWKTTIGAHYTDDAEYRWNVGADEIFFARGAEQIRDIAIGYQMDGFKGWKYPYQRVIIDEVQGEVVGFWRQIAPYQRADGSNYEVAGLGCSWFRYGGDFKWRYQQDLFDLSCVMSLFMELAADGLLEPALKKKIQQKVARRTLLPGHQTSEHKLSLGKKVRGNLALARIALLGR